MKVTYRFVSAGPEGAENAFAGIEKAAKRAPADMLFITINGRLLAESVSVETWTEGNERHIHGECLTAGDFDYEAAKESEQEIEVRLVWGESGKACHSRGKITRVGAKSAVRCLSNVTFRFVGTAEPFQ